MRSLVACAVLVVAGCRQPALNDAVGALQLAPEEQNFGAIYSRVETRTLTFRLRNTGRAALPLRWTVPGPPFEVQALPDLAQTGDVELAVLFKPDVSGSYRGQLRVEAEGKPYELALIAEAREVPTCPAANTCFESFFDLTLKKCVEQPLANGTTCDGKNACLINATCQAGRCLGAARSCDDANACTVDTCNVVIGCEHLPAPPCPSDGYCRSGVCFPQTGCGLEDAVDGTSCGPLQTCDAAQVCVAGACVVRDPPDGHTCTEASPCQPAGICAGSTCVRGPATVLQPAWSFDPFPADAGVDFIAPQLHDMVLEPTGAVTLSGFFHTPALLRANTSAAKQAKLGASRRCMLWNGRLLCADYPSAVNGKVSALDLATGEIIWTFDLHQARPEFLAMTSSLFMARMAVQGSDRLAALFEAYPKAVDPSKTTNCRLYFLAVLDASGALVTAQQVTDPVLEACNHPHPYGFGADSLGDLFISFSPTVTNPAPLVPGSPTVVMSFTRDGVFRWKFTDFSLVGGELAVSRGLLYPENSKTAVLTSTGRPHFTLAELFGRAVVTQQGTLVAPVVGRTTLQSYESGTDSARWKHTLAPGQTFASDQIRLASWATTKGPQTVALTFTKHSGVLQLKGIVTRDGSEAFTCDLDIPDILTAPQLFEVADGSLTLMEGSNACGKCDPPYAGSSAAFHSFLLKYISPANREPWVGTFGGPGHDHREEPPFETVNEKPPR